jgi:hypothetical protein
LGFNLTRMAADTKGKQPSDSRPSLEHSHGPDSPNQTTTWPELRNHLMTGHALLAEEVDRMDPPRSQALRLHGALHAK